ncbi:hypothetical protein GCM10023084_05760 [Streptomyces lacrimifluminis]|uniref:Uncharacterized protein n=1 Tax=Streptomyces lacrimifluminis TaxID=1500077 RepID=A0A917KNX7_9ACTN|nr:hypothetical protein GCM10012282_19500 [Streptomyces lacrimifluminis]
MSVDDLSPECGLGAHHYCTGPKVIRREGAPKWEVPIMVLKCGCTCHTRSPRPPSHPVNT